MDMSHQTQKASLFLALPTELQRLICAQFCPHCCRLSPLDVITLPSEDPTQPYEPSPLKALSETCIVLRDIAQPLLHHVPLVRNYTALLRTIRERPDLADSVKCLPQLRRIFCDRIGNAADYLVADQFTLVKEMAAELQMLTPQDVPFEDEFSSMLAYLHSGRYEYDLHTFAGTFQMAEFNTLLYAILMASLPCLEIINVDHWYVFERYPLDIYRHAHRRLHRAGRLVSDRCAGTAMASLHTIVVDNWRDFADRWEGRESDGRDYDYDYSNVHLDPREVFFGCASSLRELVLCSCDAPYDWPARSKATNISIWSTLPSVTAVSFDCMEWGGRYEGEDVPATPTAEMVGVAYQRLKDIATQCTALTSFKMAVYYPDYMSTTDVFSPSRLLQSLIPAASRLETLSIHIHHYTHLRPDVALLERADMDSFTKLRQLSLDEWYFCHHWAYAIDEDEGHDDQDFYNEDDARQDRQVNNDEENPEKKKYAPVCRSNNCLINMLPASVTSLNVRLREKSRAVLDLMHLATAAASGSFPKLKLVTVEAYLYVYQDRRYGPAIAQPEMLALEPKLRKAFQGAGVAVEVTGIPLK